MILPITTDSGPESSVRRSGKGTPHRARMRLASAGQLFSKLCSVVSVGQAWKEGFPWRAALVLGGFVARQETRKAMCVALPSSQ
jgi:hypothetical protein